MPPNTELPFNAFSSPPSSEAASDEAPPTLLPKQLIVVGLGMVACSFIEKLLDYDQNKNYQIRVFSEEPEGK